MNELGTIRDLAREARDEVFDILESDDNAAAIRDRLVGVARRLAEIADGAADELVKGGLNRA